VAQSDARAAAAHAFVALWLAERTASARSEADGVATRIDQAVAARVELGAAPELEAARSRAQHLRAHADAVEASQLIASAAADLGRWIGLRDASGLRTDGDPVVPNSAPPLAELAAHIEDSPVIKRELMGVRSALARADRERALVRPAMTLDLAVEAFDPTVPATNYRAQLGMEIPLFNQRGAYIAREERAADLARSRVRLQGSMLTADLVVAYRTFEAVSARTETLATAVLPATEAAARATQESYSLGRATLEAVLDAERNRIDTTLALIEARAVRANAWIDVERALGVM
jgi:outer membrane protein TolC